MLVTTVDLMVLATLSVIQPMQWIKLQLNKYLPLYEKIDTVDIPLKTKMINMVTKIVSEILGDSLRIPYLWSYDWQGSIGVVFGSWF